MTNTTALHRRFIQAAQNGDIHQLHHLIEDDPLLLRTMALSGGETPLHIACIGGHVSFVKAVLNLSPQFATELNQDGFSPLHIASANGDIQIVKELLTLGSHLCVVKGKEKRIPLHYAVSKGRIQVIQELLLICLDSITEVTARGESCLHLAVENSQIEAFKVLLDYVILHKKEQILNNTDQRGNSIMHVAAYKKQYEIMCLLLDEKFALKGKLEVYSSNKRGLTPLDLLASEGGDCEIEEMLKLAGAARVQELDPHNLLENQPAGSVRRKECSKRPSKRLQNFFKYDEIKDSPTKVRNTLLVIAVLIATATYQPVLSPPGGVWQDDFLASRNNMTTNNSSSNTQSPHTAGQSVLATNRPVSFGLFLFFNSIGFYMSLHMLNFLTLGLPLQFELRVSLTALIATYDTCMVAITPAGGISWIFVTLSVVMPISMPILTSVARDYRRPWSCAGSRAMDCA